MNKMRMLGLAGAAAFVTLGALSLGSGYDGATGTVLAGSGDAPANTTYVQPTGGAMTLGATATFTTPSSVEPTVKAAPAASGG